MAITSDSKITQVATFITTETQRMGRIQVAAVRRSVARSQALAAHHVVCAITPYGVAGNVMLVILAVSLRSLSQYRWQPGLR
ncbi:MAG: hypothetical protein KatS3mg056_0137 [Chloroflexus sp.]|jgi:hypothetical protein|nr:MAG: hypothetical protein KatS3mg056_0137 [Chloroflexus sp.]